MLDLSLLVCTKNSSKSIISCLKSSLPILKENAELILVDGRSKDNTIELPHSMTKVPKSAFPKGYFNPEALWATVDYNSASQIMRDVYKKYKKYELNGKKQMIENRETFTQD